MANNNPTNTNQAVGSLTNSAAKLDALKSKLIDGQSFQMPALASDPTTEPNPDVTDELGAQVAQVAAQIAALCQWASV